jgi:hypothetical protein
MRSAALVWAGLVLWAASPAWAQSGASGANVTIQLPNFSTVGVNTSVLVPDSGPSPYARERQAFYSRVMYRGWRPQRAFGAQRNAAIASATAQVHDARAADEMLLRAARSRRTNWVRGSTPAEIARLPRAADPALASLSDIEARRGVLASAANREAAGLVEKARQAQAAGKGNVAAIYYDMAAKRATGELKARISDEAAGLRTAANAAAPR